MTILVPGIDNHLTIKDNGDGTETVRFVDLEDIDLPNAAGKLDRGEGYVRLRIDGSGLLAGNTAYSQTFGWLEQTHRVQHETHSDPFVKKERFSGTVTSVGTANNTLDVGDSIGASSLTNAIDETKQYYVEIVAGDHVGHRFELDEAATLTAGGKVLLLNTDTGTSTGEGRYSTDILNHLPALAGDTLVLREHRTLADLCPPDLFSATNSHKSADRVLFLNDASSFDIIWMYDGSVHDNIHRWVERRTVTYVGVGASRVIRPGDAFYVNPAGGQVTLLHVGAVRENPLVRRLRAGWNFVGNPWPVDRHAAPDQPGVSPDSPRIVPDLGMTTANGFTGDLSIGSADKIQLWSADQSENFGVEGYTGYYFLEGDLSSLGLGMRSHWTAVRVPDLSDQNTMPVLMKGRGMFLNLQSPIDHWIIPSPVE